MSDGTSSNNDRHLIDGEYDSSPLDLDDDGDNDINYSATRANITTVFNTLGGLLNSNHNLFIFTTDHGARTSGYDAYMYLWYQTITDDQFAIEVAKVNAGRITIMMEQCYSGGFIDDLSGNNRVIATACAYNEPSNARTDLTYDEFAYHWISAVAGETPGGTPVDADDDNDGFVSMWEAYYFAKNHDTKNEHPQYNSSPSDMGKQLSLRGKIPYISGTNIVCTSNSTFTLNNIPPGVSLSWNVYIPNKVTPYSGTGSTATFHATCNPIGNCNLYFTISSAECGTIQVSKSLVAGGPDPYDVDLDILYSTGQPAPKSGGVFLLCPNTTYHIYLMNSSSCATSNYIWTIPPAWTKWYQYNNMISINTNSQPGGQIMVDATTCCSGCGSKRILIDYVGQYFNCGGYYMAFPNPANDYLDIDVNKENMTSDGLSIGNEYVLTMVDKMGTVKYTDEFKEFPYRINTKDMPEGLYIINLIYDGKISSIKVMIEH